MIKLLLFMLLVICIIIFIQKYNKEITLDKNEYNLVEYSCKFSQKKKFNDSRLTYGFDSNKNMDDIFKKFKIDNKMIEFYNKINKMDNVKEKWIGIDKNENSVKVYLTVGNYLYSLEKKDNKYKHRNYKSTLIRKKDLDKFIGQNNSTYFCDVFGVYKDNPMGVYAKYDESENYNLNSYHIKIINIKLKDYSNEIVNMLKKMKINIEGIDKMFKQYNNYYITWISIKYDLDICFYFRENKIE
jgi:hypothetical protein